MVYLLPQKRRVEMKVYFIAALNMVSTQKKNLVPTLRASRLSQLCDIAMRAPHMCNSTNPRLMSFFDSVLTDSRGTLALFRCAQYR